MDQLKQGTKNSKFLFKNIKLGRSGGSSFFTES